MSDKFIQTNTLNNIANAIRYRANITTRMPIEDDDKHIITMQKVLKEQITFMGFNLEPGYGGILQEHVPKSPWTEMSHAYSGNSQITGIPFIGNVIFMDYAFSECAKLTGPPSSTSRIQNAYHAYAGCTNLTGSPVIEAKPNKLEFDNLTNTWFENGSGFAMNVSGMYYNCVNLTGNAEFGGCLTTDLSSLYYNCHNLNGTSLYLTVEGAIRIYPKNLCNMMYNCTNYRAVLNNKYPSLRNTVVSDFFGTFNNCQNLTGEPIAFNGDYTNMTWTYTNCRNLTGNGCCGPLVTDMVATFQNCVNLNGQAVIGELVTDATNAYGGCINIRSADVRAIHQCRIESIFYNCQNLRGSIIFKNSPVTSVGTIQRSFLDAFRNCRNLQGVYLPGNDLPNNSFYCANMFYRASPVSRLNVVFNNLRTLNNLRQTNATGCTMTAVEEVNETVKLPIVAWHGNYEIGHELYQVKHKCYNEEYKLYMYSTE